MTLYETGNVPQTVSDMEKFLSYGQRFSQFCPLLRENPDAAKNAKEVCWFGNMPAQLVSSLECIADFSCRVSASVHIGHAEGHPELDFADIALRSFTIVHE